MTHRSGSHRIDKSDFPRLSEFVRGYLHQDLIAEHRSPLQAAKAYMRDLSPTERKKVANEAFRFRGLVRELSSAEVNGVMAQLGSSWTFIAKDDLDQVLQTLERGH
jgi:hypothetical protein